MRWDANVIRLPFMLPNNCSLSIATKTYLDELLNGDNPTDINQKARALTLMSERYFPQSIDFGGDMDKAIKLWDAVFAGITMADKQHPITEATLKLWRETDEWLKGRF